MMNGATTDNDVVNNLKQCADMIRDIADEIERGTWGSVNVQINNDIREKPRTWNDGGRYRGSELQGRTITISLAVPAPSADGKTK